VHHISETPLLKVALQKWECHYCRTACGVTRQPVAPLLSGPSAGQTPVLLMVFVCFPRHWLAANAGIRNIPHHQCEVNGAWHGRFSTLPLTGSSNVRLSGLTCTLITRRVSSHRTDTCIVVGSSAHVTLHGSTTSYHTESVAPDC
jgi:hypothetical protein